MTNSFEHIDSIQNIRCFCGTQLPLSNNQLLDLLEFDTIRPTCNKCKKGLKISKIRGEYFIREG